MKNAQWVITVELNCNEAHNIGQGERKFCDYLLRCCQHSKVILHPNVATKTSKLLDALENVNRLRCDCFLFNNHLIG